MSEVTSSTVLLKQPTEYFPVYMDFSSLLDTGETISSITSVTADPTGLTISDEAIDSDGKIKFWVADGEDGIKYRITAIIVTSLTKIFEGDGLLKVKDT